MGIRLIIFIFTFIFIAALGIPLLHDFLVDKLSVSNYEEKQGIVTDVIMKKKKDSTCENIVVDDYNIFVKCGKYYEQQFKIGDNTTYYVRKGKAYHNEHQMKSGTIIGKILDYGMIGSYLVLLFLINHNKERLSDYINEMGGIKKDTSNYEVNPK